MVGLLSFLNYRSIGIHRILSADTRIGQRAESSDGELSTDPQELLDEANRLFIHAGFCSMHGPSHEHFASNCYWDRTLWETALGLDNRIGEESIFYPKRLRLFQEIYIGHTPTTNYDVEEPMHAYNVWNIDTGAAFCGRLTALNIDTKEFWQSDFVQQLYPDEKGRNK